MADVRRSRRVVALICIAAIFFAAIVPAADYLFAAILVPLPSLFGLVASFEAPAPETVSPEPLLPRSPLPSRAPPA
jgi:hypothetical protein